MATFTEDDIISAVTFAIGNPSESEYPTTAKQDGLRRALSHYSQYKPLRRIGKFTTQADVQQYDIASSYTYLVGVTDIFYGPAGGQDLTGAYGDLYDNLLNLSGSQGPDMITNEALRVIEDQSIGVIEASRRFGHHMIDDNIVALIPTPTDIRDVYFEYTIIKTVADLKELEYQDIVDFSIIVSASDLSARRNKILQINEPGTGFVMFHSGKFLQDVVKETRVRLMKSLGVSSLALHG